MPDYPKVTNETMRPEVELLLHAARTRLQPERAERMRRLVQDGIDWHCLLETARRHRVVPLVLSNLSRWCANDLPRDVASVLRSELAATSGRNLWRTARLFDILELLQSRGIRALPFKGPALAAGVYGNLAVREFGDLDILVRRRDVPSARDALLSMGLSPYRHLSARQEELHFRHESAFEYLGANGLVVELHWELTSWRSLFPLDPETFWDRAEAVSVAGRTVYTLPSTDLFLYLCAHGAKHQWRRLQWVCDVAEFSQARNWQWPAILNRAAGLGVRRMVLVAFSLAGMLLELELPPEVRKHVEADSVAQALARQCRDRILFQHDEAAAGNQMAFFCASKERVLDKTRYLLGRGWARTLWSDKDIAFVALPNGLRWLYYAVKPLRVLREWVAAPSPTSAASSLPGPEPPNNTLFPKELKL